MNSKKYIMMACFLVFYIIMLKYLFLLLFPFLLAILCFFALKPLIDRIQQNIPIKKSAIGITLLLLFYLLSAFVFVLLMSGLFYLCIRFFQLLPSYYDAILLPFINKMSISFHQFFMFFPEDFLYVFQNWINQNILDLIAFTSQFIKSIPSFLFSFFMFIISTFFLVLDYDEMKDCFLKYVQKKTCYQMIQFKNKVLKSLWFFFKCQIILMCVTFFILLIAFMILKIEPAFLYALSICMLDSLPFIGVGIVLIPMMILYIFQGVYMKALYLLCLYFIINMIRSFLEPHLMNKEMKVPAFLLLVSMVLHIRFFGIPGIVLSPLHMSFLYQYFHKSDDLV